MAGVWAAPAGSGQTWPLTLLPSTERDGHIKKSAPKSFHRLYLSTRKHKVSGKATRVTLHSGSTVQNSVLGCVTSSPGYNSGCFLRETSPGSKPLEFQSPGVAHGRSFQGQVALSSLLFLEPCLSSTGDGLLIAGQVRRPGLGVLAIKASDASLTDVLGNGAGHTVTGSHMVEAKAVQL